MNVIIFPGSIQCEGCGVPMGVQPLKEWDANVNHVLIVCGNSTCLREGKVLKFPVTRVNCTPAIAGSEKAASSLIVPH
jgi:hypothetical protein